jgi:hypothetical protein
MHIQISCTAGSYTCMEGNYDNIPPYMSKNLPYHYYLTCLDPCCPFNISLLNPAVGLYAR